MCVKESWIVVCWCSNYYMGLRWLWHGFAFSGSGMESLFCGISCLSRGVRGCVGAAAGLYE